MDTAAETPTTEPLDGAVAGGEETGAPAGDDRLTSALDGFRDEFTGRLEQMQRVFEERLPQQEPEEEPELADPRDPEFFGDEDYAPDGSLTEEAQARQFEAILAQMVEQAAQQQVAPLYQQREAERRDREADALEERYPDLRDEETQDRVLERAAEVAQQLGNPEAAIEPAFVELVYLAMQAQERAASETPAGGGPNVPIERGGGASPAQGGDEPDLGDAIVKLAQKGKFRL